MKEESVTTVITVSGKEEPLANCRKIKNIYYKIGDNNVINSGDCYFIENKYRRAETGYIIYDYRISQYVLKSSMNIQTENGIVGFEDATPIFGAFSKPIVAEEPILFSYKDLLYECIDESIFEGNINFAEDLSTGYYHNRKHLPARRFIEPVECNQKFKSSLNYDSRDIIPKVMSIYDKTYNPKISPSVKEYGKLMTNNLSFGLEFETTKGFIPTRITNKLGLIPLRDGSVQGLEYVTIPLSGEKGIQTLLDSVKELRKRTEYDMNCSMHVHIGNLPRTEEFFLALYKVLYYIQDSIFELFPLYKKYNFGVKRKHYTKPFGIAEVINKLDTKIDTRELVVKNFDKLYTFLSLGQTYEQMRFDLDNVKSHPSDPGGTAKWNITSRYYWVNLIPLLFGNKQTIEFRIHTPTYDEEKILGFLTLCSSIINFTINNAGSILRDPKVINNLSLHHIVNSTLGRTSVLDYMYDYLAQRKEFTYYQNCKGNINYDEDEFKFRSFINWRNSSRSNDVVKKPGYPAFNRHPRAEMRLEGVVQEAIERMVQVDPMPEF